MNDENSKLREQLEKLIKVGRDKFSDLASDGDYEGFALLLFAYKQFLHADSILVLNESQDVLLVGRSMVEGLVSLDYLLANPAEFERWAKFAHVHDLETFEYVKEHGTPLPAVEVISLKSRLQEFSPLLMKPRVRGDIQQTPDVVMNPGSYPKSWLPLTISRAIRELDSPAIERYYSLSSEWHHWASASFVEFGLMARDDQDLARRLQHTLRQTLHVAIISVVSVIIVAAKHFGLDVENDIQEATAN